MKTHSLLAHLVSTFVLVSTPACVISATDSDDDDGVGSSSGADSASGNSANDSDDPTDDAAEESSSGADESSGGNATAGGEGPEDGEWIYADDGASQNDCDFFEASQGVGDFSVENHGDGTFTITPGDATDAFDCQLGGDGAFECPERFVESVTEPGVDAALDVSVAIAGTTSATSMEGEQLGSMTCAGADCGLAEDLLGTSFPCAFVIPFTAAR